MRNSSSYSIQILFSPSHLSRIVITRLISIDIHLKTMKFNHIVFLFLINGFYLVCFEGNIINLNRQISRNLRFDIPADIKISLSLNCYWFFLLQYYHQKLVSIPRTILLLKAVGYCNNSLWSYKVYNAFVTNWISISINSRALQLACRCWIHSLWSAKQRKLDNLKLNVCRIEMNMLLIYIYMNVSSWGQIVTKKMRVNVKR